MLISIIIPIINESAIMAESLSRLIKSGNKNQLEIIVVDGGSSDNSVEIARKYSDKVIVSDRKGRGYQLHKGALAAAGDILFFIHIDCELPGTWFNDMVSSWSKQSEENHQEFASFLRLFCKREWPFNAIGSMSNLWFMLTKVPHGDQTISMHRKTYFECGGFPHVPIMEEYMLHNRMKRLNKNVRLKILPGRVIVSTRRYEKIGPFRQSLLNSFILFLYSMGFPLKFLARMYY